MKPTKEQCIELAKDMGTDEVMRKTLELARSQLANYKTVLNPPSGRKEGMMNDLMEDELLKCPACRSEEVTVSHLQTFMANTGKHYCHSVKTQDANSEATCLSCQWIGRRDQLIVHNTKQSQAAERNADSV